MKPSWRQILFVALLVGATVLAYGRALHGGFIWDDDQYVSENPTLRSPDALRAIWTDPSRSPQYYPMVFTTFWIEHRLWGDDTFGYHLVNVLLHAAAAVVLWRLLRRLEVPGAALAAVLFALHPVHVESVAWITERKNVLSGLFYLSAMLCWLRFRPPMAPESWSARRWPWWALALVCFVLALLSKTVTASLPAALLLISWWKRPHRPLAETARELLLLAPFFVLGLWLGLQTAHLEDQHVGAKLLSLGLDGVERVLLAGRIAWFYFFKLLWPTPLVFIYPRWTVDASVWWQYLFPLAALALLAGLWIARRRIGRGPLVAALLFGGTLVPALGFIDVFPMRYSYVADHFQYLASIAPIALAAALITRGAARLPRPALRHAALLIPPLILALLTWRQTADYRDVETLWVNTIRKNPNATMAHINLGNLRSNRGERELAITHYEAALRVDPPETDTFVLARAHFNLANNRYALRQFDEALRQYERAIETEPRYMQGHYGRGLVLMQLGRYDAASESFRTVLAMKPDHADAARNLQRCIERRR